MALGCHDHDNQTNREYVKSFALFLPLAPTQEVGQVVIAEPGCCTACSARRRAQVACASPSHVCC
eukprot:1097258-Rhodomonas_salina.2